MNNKINLLFINLLMNSSIIIDIKNYNLLQTYFCLQGNTMPSKIYCLVQVNYL